MDLYLHKIPSNMHPLAWTLLGFGLSAQSIQRLCVHLFDQLGARLDIPAVEEIVELRWAVDWALDPGDRIPATVGEEVSMIVPGADRTGVRIIQGGLPPGLTLERHTGRISGAFAKPGLYAVKLAVGPAVKFDGLGGNGTPDEPGAWIPISAERHRPPIETVPAVDALPDDDKIKLLAELQAWERSKATETQGVGRADQTPG